MNHTERLTAAMNLKPSELQGLPCPCNEFLEELGSLNERHNAAKEKLKELTGKLEDLEHCPEALKAEFANGYDNALATSREAVAQALSNCVVARGAIDQSICAELRICDLKNRAAFAAARDQFIAPAESKLIQSFSAVLTIFNSLVEAFDEENSSNALRKNLGKLDEDTKRLATIAKNYGVSISIQPEESLKTACNAIKQSIHNALRVFPRAKFNEVLRRVGAAEFLTPHEAASQRSFSEKSAIARAEQDFLATLTSFPVPPDDGTF